MSPAHKIRQQLHIRLPEKDNTLNQACSRFFKLVGYSGFGWGGGLYFLTNNSHFGTSRKNVREIRDAVRGATEQKHGDLVLGRTVQSHMTVSLIPSLSSLGCSGGDRQGSGLTSAPCHIV